MHGNVSYHHVMLKSQIRGRLGTRAQLKTWASRSPAGPDLPSPFGRKFQGSSCHQSFY